MRLKPAQNTARLNVIKCNVVVRPPHSKVLACKQATTMIKGKTRSVSIFKQTLYALRCIAREWIFLISISFIPAFQYRYVLKSCAFINPGVPGVTDLDSSLPSATLSSAPPANVRSFEIGAWPLPPHRTCARQLSGKEMKIYRTLSRSRLRVEGMRTFHASHMTDEKAQDGARSV